MCGNTQVDAGNFHSFLKNISKNAPSAPQNEFEKQFMVKKPLDSTFITNLFQVLDKISPKPEHVVDNVAQKYPDKNRTEEYLPGICV